MFFSRKKGRILKMKEIIRITFKKIITRSQDNISKFLNQRKVKWPDLRPFISFTFDDFPRSAFISGAELLKKYNIRATYYVSLGLMGKKNQFWEYFTLNDLHELIESGHELGSHTYDHVDAWSGPPKFFEESILKNQQILEQIRPGYKLRTLSYCTRNPHPQNKKIAGKHFLCCRGGGNRINRGILDLNLISSYFIDHYHRQDPDYFYRIIDKNSKINGWLVFSGHDISNHPSPYGCTPSFFEKLIQHSCASGALILPVAEVIDYIFCQECKS
jgi:peptidoglycan/xylan/chitin deacetylase (PgdA/CDA1 family)